MKQHNTPIPILENRSFCKTSSASRNRRHRFQQVRDLQPHPASCILQELCPPRRCVDVTVSFHTGRQLPMLHGHHRHGNEKQKGDLWQKIIAATQNQCLDVGCVCVCTFPLSSSHVQIIHRLYFYWFYWLQFYVYFLCLTLYLSALLCLHSLCFEVHSMSMFELYVERKNFNTKVHQRTLCHWCCFWFWPNWQRRLDGIWNPEGEMNSIQIHRSKKQEIGNWNFDLCFSSRLGHEACILVWLIWNQTQSSTYK